MNRSEWKGIVDGQHLGYFFEGGSHAFENGTVNRLESDKRLVGINCREIDSLNRLFFLCINNKLWFFDILSPSENSRIALVKNSSFRNAIRL